jgi:hypothetical protein
MLIGLQSPISQHETFQYNRQLSAAVCCFVTSSDAVAIHSISEFELDIYRGGERSNFLPIGLE